jgi:hypothetical protein
MLMHDHGVLQTMFKYAAGMAKAPKSGGKLTEHLKVEHERFTAELSAVDLLLSLEKQRYRLEAMLKAPKPRGDG